MTVPRVYKTDAWGPAGTPLYGIEMGYPPVKGCFLCGNNALLAFEPWVMDTNTAEGFVMPASFPGTVKAQGDEQPTFHLIPEPFTVMAAPYYHLTRPRVGRLFQIGFDPDWMGQLQALLELVPDLRPDVPFSFHAQYGQEAGARPQGYENNHMLARLPKHGFVRITYGRDLLKEVEATDPPQKGELVATNNLGLDTILHGSRVRAGSLPAEPQILWNLWESVAHQPDAFSQYNRSVLALAGA